MSNMNQLENSWAPNKELMWDDSGRPLTQSLFLETGYNKEAIYTFKDEDYEYNDRVYKSIKKLYMEENDPTEYSFATKYFINWKHWLRICENKLMRKHIDEWREELEMKLRSHAVQQMMKEAIKGNATASKWLADKGWDKRLAGRPTKVEKERELKLLATVNSEYSADVVRLNTGT